MNRPTKANILAGEECVSVILSLRLPIGTHKFQYIIKYDDFNLHHCEQEILLSCEVQNKGPMKFQCEFKKRKVRTYESKSIQK